MGVSKIERNSLSIPSKSSTPSTSGRNIKMDEVASGCIPGNSRSHFRTKLQPAISHQPPSSLTQVVLELGDVQYSLE